ncbi:MAG: hypothetical protein ABW352_06795 [Polyangiales bacterium]
MSLRCRVTAPVFLLAALSTSAAHAKPEGPRAFCETYPETARCMGTVPDCSLCHTSTSPAAWNAYGLDVLAALPKQAGFEQELPAALLAVDARDSDGDGFSNRDELELGSRPGDDASRPSTPESTPSNLPPNPDYLIGRYDPAYAYRRASTLYCGQSPSYDELAPFRAPDADASKLRALIHERIEACLHGEYWLKEGLVRLGDDRIRPITNLGQDSKVAITLPISSLSGEIKLRSVMADYSYDYRLWVHALSGDRDARDLLLARYFVVENADGTTSLTEELIANPAKDATAGGQKLAKEYRAGMITSMWFLTRNTMFTSLPRTTAAAAYRAYLGMDISKMQGLMPVAGEPDDIDKMGVKEARCAVCHSTLDPLAYAFAPYNGLQTGIGAVFELVLFGTLNGDFGAYDEARPTTRMPEWSWAEQQPVLLGKQVKSLREWAEVAAESDEFARNLANVFFVHALEHEPEGAEVEELGVLWQGLREDGYSANKLIHRLIDTAVFGAP